MKNLITVNLAIIFPSQLFSPPKKSNFLPKKFSLNYFPPLKFFYGIFKSLLIIFLPSNFEPSLYVLLYKNIYYIIESVNLYFKLILLIIFPPKNKNFRQKKFLLIIFPPQKIKILAP